MRHWLLKSEPSSWSWEDQVKAGAKGTPWNGVHNHTAKLNMMAMKKGDTAFFYHSNEGKAIVGTVEVVREAYPDPDNGPKDPWVLVDVKALAPFPKPVTLADAKAEPAPCQDVARGVLSPLRAAGHGRGMEDRLRHGRLSRLARLPRGGRQSTK